METYIITAKTVEEAISIANREYAKDGKEVSHVILEMPKKGFLGIGSKDAKIKITVTESESAKIGSELSSLVADLRGMKVQTNRGGSEEDGRDSRGQNPRKQNGQQNNKSAQQAKQTKPAKPQDKAVNQDKSAKPQDKPAKPQNAQNQKPQTPKADAPKQNVQNQNKKPQPPKAENTAPKQNTQNQNPPKPKAPKAETAAPKTDVIEKVEKAEKVEKLEKIEKIEKTERTEKVEKPEKIEKAEKVEKTEGGYKSSLRNQAKPSRRGPQKAHDTSLTEVEGTSAVVSAPMGLSDFTGDGSAKDFGNGSSSGRISNDIRRKNRNQRPAPAQAEEAKTKILNTSAVEIGEMTEFVPAPLDDEPVMTIPAESSENIENEVFDIEGDESGAEGETAADPRDDDRQKVGITAAEMETAVAFTNTLLANMQIPARAVPVECPEGEEYITEGEASIYPKINIEGEGTGILIGHHGETLDAVQYLVNLSALRHANKNTERTNKNADYVKIIVDVENYRIKREETLRALARRMAARAVKYKRNVFLEPMNAYERRIIHSELHNVPDVSTHSVGADKNRKIIITYEGADKVQSPRREHGSDRGNRPQKGERSERAERGERSERSGGNNGSAGHGRNENRRPKKIQKMPIEKLPDFLERSTSDEPGFHEVED